MESNKKGLSQKRLKELMDYDPETGVFVRSVDVKGAKKESIAGTDNGDGYLKCTIDGVRYYCHRLAWLYIHGYFPENGMDHINRVRADNRIKNLREVSAQCNTRNCGIPNTNTSGVKGVGWHKHRKKWEARVCVGTKNIFLGRYNHKHNAVCARLAAEQCLGWAGCDSNSPAYQYVQNMLSGALKTCLKIKIQDVPVSSPWENLKPALNVTGAYVTSLSGTWTGRQG